MKSERFERKDTTAKIVLIYTILLIACGMTIYPLLNVLSIALRPSASLFSTSLKIIPDGATLENFRLAFVQYSLASWLRNSLVIALTATCISVMFSIGAAYAFSRFEFTGKKTGMTLILVTQMFPATMMLLPLFIMLSKIGMVNNIFGLAIVYVSTSIPFNIWMLKGYFDTIPKSLEESAYVDGASIFRTFYQIILPLAKPPIALSALNSFMAAWSEYIIARAIITKQDWITLPVGLTSMQSQFSTAWGTYSAAAIITALPVVVLFIYLSKYLVGGLTAGSVKG